ncbi:MAG: 16S rRNA (cytosine(1402)-N(4))-methyltransferase RsmH [Brevefilum sp.]
MKNTVHGGSTFPDDSGNRYPHQPVLYQEVLDALEPHVGGFYLDGTLGAGGHALGILNASAPDGRLLGLDVDPEALAIARQRLFAFNDRTVIKQASYRLAPKVLEDLGWDPLDGILLDLGVSSMQIDRPERGFSFVSEGPLDMRFNQETGRSAADLVNTLSESEIADILWEFGEERYSRRIARAIVKARPIHTTRDLADVVKEAVPGYSAHIHPATRTFQALRIAANKELETVAAALPELTGTLASGGRIAVISFHSLEDRIVKQFFRRESKDCICPPEQPICTCEHVASLKVLTKKPIMASEREIQENPRSSSARLRAAEKITKA